MPKSHCASECDRNGDQRRGHRPADKGSGKIGGHHGGVTLPLVTVSGLFDGIADMHREAPSQPIKRQINNGRGVEREQLA